MREEAGARFLSRPDCPSVYDVNHGARVRVEEPEAIERVLARADALYADCGHRFFYCDPFTPPRFEAQLALRGYRPDPVLELALVGELRAHPRPFDLREARSEADWRSVERLVREDHLDAARREAREPYAPELSGAMARLRRERSPQERTWLARVEEVDCGYFSSWPGENGVGKVEDLFTLPSHRHRGIATALIARAVADARARGADVVNIAADPADTPRTMYAALGFEPVCLRRGWLLTL